MEIADDLRTYYVHHDPLTGYVTCGAVGGGWGGRTGVKIPLFDSVLTLFRWMNSQTYSQAIFTKTRSVCVHGSTPSRCSASRSRVSQKCIAGPNRARKEQSVVCLIVYGVHGFEV